MKERPILFSTPMVQAILAGKKTQTRRLVKPQPTEGMSEAFVGADGIWRFSKPTARHPISLSDDDRKCPYGKPGDMLWVRESFWEVGKHVQSYPEDDEWKIWSGRNIYHYHTNGLPLVNGENNWRVEPGTSVKGKFIPYELDYYWRKFPSIHMPKAAARIWLQVENVRVERLHDITASDAMDEGVEDILFNKKHPLHLKACENGIWDADERAWYTGSVDAFKALWQSINGEESWNANPWVWVVEFKRVER